MAGASLDLTTFQRGSWQVFYAECGRSYALAPGQTSAALDLLQKALNVFTLIPEPNMEEVLEISACRASLARVLRRVGQLKKAQDQFLQAMQLLAEVA